MIKEHSDVLIKGDILLINELFENGVWLEEAAGEFAKHRRKVGTKVVFLHHHHHLPEFLFCEQGGETAIYHHDEVSMTMERAEQIPDSGISL